MSRDRVLTAAVELADEVGLAGVSMRRLAQRLGVVPMALYKHVADKDELLDAMVDVVIGEFRPPDPALDWKDGVRQQLLSARSAVLGHPWARRAIESRTRRTPVVLAYMDSIAGMFISAGFSADLTHHVMHALGNRIWGFNPEMFDESQRPADSATESQADSATESQPDPEVTAAFAQRYPYIVQIAVAATEREPADGQRGCDEQFEFEFGLDLLLDGAERLRRSGWSSGGTGRS
ncbi:MAG: TetR/AcrR family transcriptional regulator [Intrasporangium sp.]